MNDKNFIEELRQKREEYGVTQTRLAVACGISREYYNRIEKGKQPLNDELREVIEKQIERFNPQEPLFLLIDYFRVRFPTTDALAIIRDVLQLKPDYMLYEDYGKYGYESKYVLGDINVMCSMQEHLGVLLELKGRGCRQMESYLLAQERSWYDFMLDCLTAGGKMKRLDLAINDMCGLLDIPVLSEKYKNGGADCRCKNYENVQGGKLSGKNRNLASTLYIGSKASTKYFCLYEKQKEQATKKKHTDIINRFEIRLRDKKAVQAVEELLLTYNPHGLVFYLITDFVQFPDYPLWEIFISHDSLPFEMNPVPVNMERTLQWLERQVMPSIVMIEEIDRLTGSNYMKMIDECTHLSEKQEMLVEQMCTDIADVIESEGVFYE